MDCILRGSIDSFFELTDFEDQNLKEKEFSCLDSDYQDYFALCLYDITNFLLYLLHDDMIKIYPDLEITNYVTFIYDDSPLYDVIKIWDDDFSVSKNISKDSRLILENKKKILKNNCLFFEN